MPFSVDTINLWCLLEVLRVSRGFGWRLITSVVASGGEWENQEWRFWFIELTAVGGGRQCRRGALDGESERLQVSRRSPDFWQCFTNLLDLLIS